MAVYPYPRSASQVGPLECPTCVRIGSIQGSNPDPTTHRRRSQSRSRQYSYDAVADTAVAHYRKRAIKYKRKFRILSLISSLLVAVTAYLLVPKGLATTRSTTTLGEEAFGNVSKPFLWTGVENGTEFAVPIRHPEFLNELGGFYKGTGVTLAHFGWLLHSPYKALNYDPRNAIRDLHISPNKAQNREALDKYMEYLKKPWQQNSPFCARYVLFEPKGSCERAVNLFKEHHERLLNRVFLHDWAHMVKELSNSKTTSITDNIKEWIGVAHQEEIKEGSKCEEAVWKRIQGKREGGILNWEGEYKKCDAKEGETTLKL